MFFRYHPNYLHHPRAESASLMVLQKMLWGKKNNTLEIASLGKYFGFVLQINLEIYHHYNTI